jgi:predicted RNase H-like HicB family nuclease
LNNNDYDSGVILTRDKDGWIVAEVPELPGCISQGKNETEAVTNIQEAIAAWLWAEEEKKAEAQL